MAKYFFLFLFLSLTASAHTIEVFTIHQRPVVTPLNIKIYYLDDIALLQNILNQELKESANLASKKDMKKILVKFTSKNREQYLLALNGIIKAQQYGINKIPAIVIDGKYQILGTTDINKALISFDNYSFDRGEK